MWIRFARIILRYRFPIIGLVFLFSVFMAYQASFVKMKYEYTTMLPKSDPVFQDYLHFRSIFGEDAMGMVLGVQDSDFFEVQKIKDWQKLTNDIRALTGVKHVISVTDAVDLKKKKGEKKFDIRPIFPPNISSQAELDSLKEVLYNRPIYRGLLYNDTASVFAMSITMDADLISSPRRDPIMKKLIADANAFGNKYHLKVHFSGLPYTRTLISRMIKREIVIFTFIALLVTSILLFYFFRSFKVVVFSMLIVVIAVIWAFGTMVILGYEITILTGMIPPLLIVIGIPNSVFLLNKYHQEFVIHRNQIKALHRVIYKVGQATFLTNLTTAIGFATFMVTRNASLVEFGIVASLNIMGLFVLSILLIPIFFSFAKEPSNRHLKHLDKSFLIGILNKLVIIVTEYRRWIYITVVLALILSIFGIMRMKTTGYIVDDIPKDNPVYIDLKYFEHYFGGVMPFEVMVDTKHKKGGMRLKNLDKINKFEEEVSAMSEISSLYSVVDGLKFAKQGFYNGNPNRYKMPDKQELSFLYKYISGESDSLSLLDNLMDSTKQIVRISGRVEDIGTNRMNALLDSVHHISHQIFNPKKFKVTITGSSIVFTAGTSYLVKNLFTSLGLAVLLIAVFMAMMFKSPRMVVASLIPNLLPLIITAALMGYFDIPIKASTVLVYSIAFGIAVDNAIHFLAKYRQELHAHPDDIRTAVTKALRETGISIVYTATILIFGFSIFMFSQFGGTQALGLLVTITLLVAVLANLLFLPSLILSINFFTTKTFSESLKELKDDFTFGKENDI